MLVVLEVVVGSEVGRQIKIPQDQTCKIGRTNWADETFSDDVMMSGQHFEIQNDGKYCWLRDLDSRNGTRVDSDFVKENLVLRDGQTIAAGRTQFRVTIEGGAKNPYESTNLGPIDDVVNPALTFGSQAFAAQDPRFPVPVDSPSKHGTPPAPPGGPPAPPPGTPLPPGMPAAGNNIELPPGDTPRLPGQVPPGREGPPPWKQVAQPLAPGETPAPAHQPPGPHPAEHLPPGAPPPGMPPAWGPGQRGGDGPVFKFAKGGSSPPPLGSPPPGQPPLGPPGTPPTGPSGNFPAPPGTPSFGASPLGPPPSSPGYVPSGTPQPPGGPDWESADNLSPPGQPPAAEGPLPWSPDGGFAPGGNPNLDFGNDDDPGEDELGLDGGPMLDFDEDVNDDPRMGAPSFSKSSGPTFTPPPIPSGMNPNLIGWDDEPEENPFQGPSAEAPPPTQPPPNVDEGTSPLPPLRAEPNPNWRNPDYASVQPGTPSQAPEPQAAPVQSSADTVRGYCFLEETADSGYPYYHSVMDGVPSVPFSPFALVSQLATLARPVLAIHFMRAEQPIPEDLEGVPLRADLDAKFAALGGPMLYCPSDLEPFREIIDQLWGLDAISVLFTSGDPQAVVDHFREGLFAPKRGDLPEPTPGPQFFAVFSPNLLTTFLSARDQETVDKLLGPTIEGVLTEVADMPDSWQLFAKKSWAERLKKLGMNRVVTQPH